jgi:hypothetical protein
VDDGLVDELHRARDLPRGPVIWLRVWWRAVVTPAGRRAQGAWVGATIVGAIVFGPNGLPPHTLTDMAWHVPAVAAVLGMTWLLLFLPVARVLVRADGARYLYALPGPRRMSRLVAAGVMVALQAPWLALWILGDGARGALVVGAMSVAIAAIARWQPRPVRGRAPVWRGAGSALAAVYARALVRRAGDALVRGAGLAVLAGLAAGLIVRNNELTGLAAARAGAVTISVVLVPGWSGALLPLVDAHRATAWLAASLGIAEASRRAVLALMVAALYVTGAAIASLATIAVVAPVTAGGIAAAAIIAALAGSFVATRGLVWADRSQVAPGLRVVVGAIVASAVSVIALEVVA